MYFWRLNKLREQLATNPLNDKEALSYLLAFTSCYFVIIFLHTLVLHRHEPYWYLGYLTLFLMLKLAGIIYCYLCNGGKKGKHFLSRYFSLAWVEFVRFFVFGLIIVNLGIYFLTFIVANGTNQIIFLNEEWIAIYILFALIIYYIRLGYHFRIIIFSKIS